MTSCNEYASYGKFKPQMLKFTSFPKTPRKFLNIFEGHLTSANIWGRKMEGLKSPTPLEL